MMRSAQTTSSPDQRYHNLLSEVAVQPVFIMGDHRSGTTILYRLLDATGAFNVVRAYHIVNYDAILSNHVNDREEAAKRELRERFAALGITDRMIDGVAVTPDLPEEYGFLIQPARNKVQLHPANLPQFMELCRKIQYVSAQDRPLLLKNPWEVLNFAYVKQALPDAKFIFIHRHPLHVINSQLRAIRDLVTRKNAYLMLIAEWYRRLWNRPQRRYITRLLFSSWFDLGLRLVTRHVALVTSYFLQHSGSLPEIDHISIRYEDLCDNPHASVDRIMHFLGLTPQMQISYRALIERRSSRLLPEVERKQCLVAARLEDYLTHCGYDTDLPATSSAFGSKVPPTES